MVSRDSEVGLQIYVKKRERFPNGIPLCYVAAADRPSRAIMDPGGVLLCHGEELRRREDPQSLDQVPND